MGGQLTALGWEWLLEAPTFPKAGVQMPPQPARLFSNPLTSFPAPSHAAPLNCLPRRLTKASAAFSRRDGWERSQAPLAQRPAQPDRAGEGSCDYSVPQFPLPKHASQ